MPAAVAARARRCPVPGPVAAAAVLCLAAWSVAAQPLPPYRRTPPAPPPGVPAEAPPQATLTADEVVSRIGAVTQAQGDVELQRLDVDLLTDYLQYDQGADTAHAQGNVRVRRGGDWFTADRMDLQIQKSAGTLVGATYGLGRTNAGGTASRIDLQDRDHATAYDANYTSCPRNGSTHPDWVLSGRRIDIDTVRNEGRAEGAVLHFLGVPILAAPSLSFPVTSERKSGWLPPTSDFSSTNGLTFGVPYYWNYSPNVDATLTPSVITKRGASLGTEVRYLGSNDLGQMTAYALPGDALAGYSRGSFQWAHEGQRGDLDYSVRWQEVSDDAFWKDFPHQMPSLTQRLLPIDLSAARHFPLLGQGELDAYARVERWQTLQDPGTSDVNALIQAPFQRSPQVGLRGDVLFDNRLHVNFVTEANRFDLANQSSLNVASAGERAHVIAGVSREFAAPWGRLEPRLTMNGAVYHTDQPMSDGRNDATRWVPTFSTDSSMSLERNVSLFGRDYVQTLEPRLLYVFTPYRRQASLPLWDTAPKDFNSFSIYSDNDFTGEDRISDLNALTAGASTRFNDAVNGHELGRVGLAQRFLFQDEVVNPIQAQPFTSRVSDVLLWGSTSALKGWNFDGEVEFNPSSSWTQRAIASTRYSPGPFRTVGVTYRYARESNEQYEVYGQWPIYHRPAPSSEGCCEGTLYAVGRVDYSVTDKRANYAVGGLEYDAGCWVGRLILERTSTGRNQATTHVVLQLELLGLSTLGSGSLRILKDNVPSYQPLHDESASAQIPH